MRGDGSSVHSISLLETIRDDVHEEYYKWEESALRHCFFH